MASVLTWYDVLGVLPGASPGEVHSAYQARTRLLDPQMFSGAPSKVRTLHGPLWMEPGVFCVTLQPGSGTTKRSAPGEAQTASTSLHRFPRGQGRSRTAGVSPQIWRWRRWPT
jgi:hypothetical protein